MWPIIGSIASLLFSESGPIGTYFKTKTQAAQAARDLELEVRKNELEYAKEIAKANVEQQKNKLAATSQSFKFVSYVLLNTPIIIICINPAWGREIFDNIGMIPSWYAQLYVAVVAVIWGLPIAGSAVSGIFGAVQQAWLERKDKKIEQIAVLGEATALNLDKAKKEIFDTIRKGTGALTQAQVDAINPVLDKVIQLQANAAQPAAPAVNIQTGN